MLEAVGYNRKNSKKQSNKKDIPMPIDTENTFDALSFYQSLSSFKNSVAKPELGENNNAIQNLQILNSKSYQIQNEETKDESLVCANNKIARLDEKAKFISEKVPNSHASTIKVDDWRIYGGRFTSKGNLYYCSSQSIIGIYDSSDPYKMKKIKSIFALDVNWTISSMDTTADEEYLVYSSLSPYLHIVDLQTLSKFHLKINMSENSNYNGGFYGYGGYFGIFSCKFSGDGNELVWAANNGCIKVFDIEKEEKSCNIANAHNDDISTVCFANRNNSNILFTGSDDFFIKAWDRRILDGKKPIGCFIGHREGITHIDSRGDERYVASNGKDQTLKLWDIRCMNEMQDLKNLGNLSISNGFDYRWENYPYKIVDNHEKDKSVMTFRGHTVLQTLIRCYFSPSETTNQRYLYSGSADGSVYVFDILTGENKTHISTSSSDCIRDVSWHPNVPVIAATSFDGSISVWEFDSTRKFNKRNQRKKPKTAYGYGYGARYRYSDSSDQEMEDEDIDDEEDYLEEEDSSYNVQEDEI